MREEPVTVARCCCCCGINSKAQPGPLADLSSEKKVDAVLHWTTDAISSWRSALLPHFGQHGVHLHNLDLISLGQHARSATNTYLHEACMIVIPVPPH